MVQWSFAMYGGKNAAIYNAQVALCEAIYCSGTSTDWFEGSDDHPVHQGKMRRTPKWYENQ